MPILAAATLRRPRANEARSALRGLLRLALARARRGRLPGLRVTLRLPRLAVGRGLRPLARGRLLAASIVGRVEARDLEMDRDGMQDTRRRGPAHLALGDGVVGDALHHLEAVPVATSVLVDRHASRVY